MMNRKNCRYVIVPAMLAMLLTASLTGCGTKEGADSMSDADTTTVTDSARDDDSKSGMKEDVEDMVTDAEDGVRDLVTDAGDVVKDVGDAVGDMMGAGTAPRPPRRPRLQGTTAADKASATVPQVRCSGFLL